MSAEQHTQSVARFEQLKQQARRAIDSAQLSQIVRDLTSTTERVDKLPADLVGLRRRGYAFAAYLEALGALIGGKS